METPGEFAVVAVFVTALAIAATVGAVLYAHVVVWLWGVL